MDKFLNVIDDYILKYAYYREPIAGSKYLDINFQDLKNNNVINYEIDSMNKYDDNAIKLFMNDIHLGYVHKNYIQEMIQVYHKRKDYKIEIHLNKIDVEKEELGFQIAFYDNVVNLFAVVSNLHFLSIRENHLFFFVDDSFIKNVIGRGGNLYIVSLAFEEIYQTISFAKIKQ